MIALVTGGRRYGSNRVAPGVPACDRLRETRRIARELVAEALDALDNDDPIDELFVGDCPTGADEAARYWADGALTSGARVFMADWFTHGKAAGPIRNREMVDAAVIRGAETGKKVLVLAFPGGRGTADCVRRARKAGLTVREVRDEL